MAVKTFICPNADCGKPIPIDEAKFQKKDPKVTCPHCRAAVTIKWDPKKAVEAVVIEMKKRFKLR